MSSKKSLKKAPQRGGTEKNSKSLDTGSLSVDALRTMLNAPEMIDFEVLARIKNLNQAKHSFDLFLAEARTEIKALEKVPHADASYESVVVPLLTGSQPLSILYSFVDTLNSVCASEVTRPIIEYCEPKMVALGNDINLSRPLYGLLLKVQRTRLDPAHKRSVDLIIRDMRHSGVHLDQAKRTTFKKINKELSVLAQKFENHVIDSRKIFSHHITDEAVLGEMSEGDKKEAQAAAAKKSLQKGFLFTLLPQSYSAIMKYCTDRAVRQLFYENANSVATSGKNDNRPLIVKILKLRSQKAKLMGKKNYAEYVLDQRMAPSVSVIEKLMSGVFKKAHVKAREEVATLEEFARHAPNTPMPETVRLSEWDVGFYNEQYRRSNFKINEAQLKEYFELDTVLDGLFETTRSLYGLTFTEMRTGRYAEGVRTFKVYRNNIFCAYYIADMYARPSKRGGAWCNVLREGYQLDAKNGCIPIVINVMNFPTPTKQHPALLPHREVETLFHEFGHAVHTILSSNQLPNLNGFHVEWDFVEFPSQIFENWTWEPAVLKTFARHYKTKEIIPAALLKKMWDAKKWFGGYHVVRQNEFGFLDMILHTDPPPKSATALDAAYRRIVTKRSVLPKIASYKMYASFGHIFAGGYAAGYYSYLWAEVLEADCYEFLKKRGVVRRRTGSLFADAILSPGARYSGAVLFKNLMKRGPKIEPLLEKYGI